MRTADERRSARRRRRAFVLGAVCGGLAVATAAGVVVNPWRAEGSQSLLTASPAASISSPRPGIAPVEAAGAGGGASTGGSSAPSTTPASVSSSAAAAPVSAVSSAVPAPVSAPSSPTGTPSGGATTTPTTPIAGGVLRADGSVDPVAYRSTPAVDPIAAGVAYRFGPEASGARAATTVPAPAEKTLQTQGRTATYQLLGPQDPSKNDYSSDQGQVGYVSAGRKTPGVDTIETLSMVENTFSMKPRLSWTLYGQGHPSPDFIEGGTAKCLADLQAKPGRFVAQARAYAHGERTANALAVFDNGVIAASGTNTARGRFCTRLPQQLHPTAISITNGNEFALVTAWNTTTLRSELAVVALGGAQKRGSFWDYEWTDLYPGFRNYGMPTFGKLLGTVALPMAAATGVSAVSNQSMGDWLSKPGGGNVQPTDLPLTDEANRQSFISGVNKDKFAKAGYAVVFSREEHKVSFVDLQPLFASIRDGYFGSRATFDAVRANIGAGAKQWPYAFSAAPASAPVVVKTVTTAQAPTAVAGLLSGAKTPRAYVGTVDGRLHVFAVGGLASDQPATAGSIVEQGTIQVGANPTGITYMKDRPNRTDLLDSTLIVTARGDRSVQWVSLNGSSGSVIRTLRDSRLDDPIAAEDNNTHGTESYVVSVADYGARRLFNYRYGTIVLHTNGGARSEIGQGFQFGGGYDPKGKPFSISITNVT